jgi:glycosyltransferase involved in cell wall biosynthesis
VKNEETWLKVLLAVHYFFPDHFYGTETYTLEIARDLRSRGYEVEILSAMSPGESGGSGEILYRYVYDDFKVHCIDYNLAPHTEFKQLYYRPEMASVYNSLLSEIRPDLLHVTHLMNHTAVLLEVADACGIPALATLTDFFGICFNSRLADFRSELCSGPEKSSRCLYCYMAALGPDAVAGAFRLGKRLARNQFVCRGVATLLAGLCRLPITWKQEPLATVQALTARAGLLRQKYSCYRKMVAPTDFLFEAYAANHFPVAKLVKINFGINWQVVEGFRSVRKYDPARPLRFGYIGQIAEHKGVDLLIEAFRAVNPGCHELKIYGSPGPGAPYFEELSQLMEGDPAIVFAGTFPENELGSRLAELDFLVIPSRWYENSPLVLLYALATRTPVIVSDVKGMTEFVKDGVNGLTFTRGSLPALTAVLQRIADDPGVLEKFSRQADYTKTVTDHVDEIVALYRDILP